MEIPPVVAGCWFLSGATASGKTAVGLGLAQRLDAEIISLDSMALYRRLDLGTAKPTPEERARVPHHLVDVLEPDQEYSLAQYVTAAHQAVAEIRGRGKQVLFVGGTPLYLKALLRGVESGPPPDWDYRESLEAAAAKSGQSDYLHARLAEVDPASAAKLHPNDTKRIIRALEVFSATGHPISASQQQFETPRPADECAVFVLSWPPEVLRERIERRVRAMFDAGLVAEVQGLLDARIDLSRTARQAVGYREVLDYLASGGERSNVIAAVAQNTAQLAKRQRTWFRSLQECRSVKMAEPWEPAAVAERILRDASV